MFNKCQEDYLRGIYGLYEELSDKKKGIKKVDVAKVLGISKPGVTQMMKKLQAEGLVEVGAYSSIFFTPKGLGKAKKITRNYRIIELFLYDILGLRSSGKIREEAHKLEHAFSSRSVNRLEKLLKDTKACPHGKKIPKI
jgi:DtxR family Mn-dependent transcriptional regulator